MITRISCWGLALLLAAVGGVARAEPGPLRLVVETLDGDPAASRARLERALRARGVALEAPEPAPPAGFEPARLQVLADVERHLIEARGARARLEDGLALRELWAARARLHADLALPGAARWLAEVELQLGLLAAQMDREALALQSFGHAVALDGERSLGAAEAPPDTLALWQRAASELRQADRGRFVVESDVPATVYVDDRRLGPAPQRLELPPGPHLLRLQATGHRPYAALLDVLAGERPAVRVALAPDPRHVPAAPVPRAGESPAALSARVRSYSARYPSARLWWLHAPRAPGEGPSLWRCQAGVCHLRGTWAVEAAPVEATSSSTSEERSRARRIAPWLVAGAMVAAAVVVAATVRRPEAASPEQVVTLDSGDLRP